MKVEEIRIDKIIIPTSRVRATFTDEQYQELKASILNHGFKIPILVREKGEGEYELIDGEHRINILKELGKETVPAIITEDDDYKATMLNILANTARGTQNPMDVAEALRRTYEAGAGVKELAGATGHSEDWVRLYLTLTELEDWVKDALRQGKLKVGHVNEALRFDDDREIYSALKTALDLGWTVSVLKYYVDQRLMELETYRQVGRDGFVEAPPTPSYAQYLVEYRDCMACKRKVNQTDLFMPVICIDCRTMLEWLVEQLGDPKEAMQTVYNALQYYFEMQKRMQQEYMQKQQQQELRKQREAGANQLTVNIGHESSEITEEDLRLLKKIKALREAGLL